MLVWAASCHHAFFLREEISSGGIVVFEVAFDDTYRVFQCLGRDVFEGDREVDEVEINVSKTPGLVLSFGLSESMVFLVIVVPELGDDKDLFTLDEAFVDGTLDALACFALVLVVVCAIEEAVADFDGLRTVSLICSDTVSWVGNARCRLCRRPGRLGLSRGRSLREAFHGQRRV